MTKNKFNTKLLSILFLGLLIFISACGKDSNSNESTNNNNTENNEQSQEVYELKFAHVQDDNHPTSHAVNWLSEQLEERTDGQVKVKLYANSTLGGPEEVISGMNAGDVDLSWITTTDAAKFAPEFNIFSVLYIIGNQEHFTRIAEKDGEVMEEMNDLIMESDIGSRLVGVMGGSPRRIYNSVRPIESPDDLNDLNIRIQDSAIEAEGWKRLGAKPVPLAWSELYSGLQAKVVDAAESATASYGSNQLFEVAPYHSITEHQYAVLPVLMSNKTYEKLPDDLLEIVLEALDEAGKKSWELQWEADEELVDELIEQGIEINELDIEPFKELIGTLSEEVAEEHNATKLLELIRKVAE